MAIAPPEEVFEFLKKAHDEFQPLSEMMVFDKTHPLQPKYYFFVRINH